MKTIHQILQESVSGGFWHFCGYWILTSSILFIVFGVPAKLMLLIVHKIARARTIKAQGYPPEHCDGDGDAYVKDDY